MAFFDFRFKPYRHLMNPPPELDSAKAAVETDESRTTINAGSISEYGIATLSDGRVYDFKLIAFGDIDLTSSNIVDASNNTIIKSMTSIWIGEGSIEVKDFRLTLSETQALGMPAIVRPLGSAAEKIYNGKTGFIAESEKLFSEYAIKLLSDLTYFKTVNKECKNLKQARSWNKVAEEFIQVFKC